MIQKKYLRNLSQVPTIQKFSDHEKIRQRSEVVKGDIIMAMIGTIGNPVIVETEEEFSIKNIALFKKNKIISDLSILKYFILSPLFKEITDNRANGTTQKFLSLTVLRTLKFPLAPLGEQERIVQKIKSCFEKIDATEQSLINVETLLEKYRESLLAKAFRGELIPQNESDKPAINLIKMVRTYLEENNLINKRLDKKIKTIDKSEFFEIPKKWEWVRLGSISSKIVDGAHHTPKYMEDGINFISVKDIRNHELSFDNTKYISQESHDELSKRCNPEIGDVLITKSGTIGRTCVVKDSRPFSLFVSVALVKVPSTFICSEYVEKILWYSVNSHFSSQFIKGSAIKNLHLQELINIPIALPPLDMQKKIVEKANDIIAMVNNLQSEITKKRKLIKRMRESVLKSAFEGQLVEQIKSEGTGKELLEKILTMKEAEKPVKKTKKKVTKKTVNKKTSKKK